MAKARRKSRSDVVKEPIIAERLAELMRDRSIRRFAGDCGVNYRRLAVWLKGNNAPEAENLRRIADATGVSVDWLLGILDAPMMRDRSRSQATLEIDLVNYVRRELTRRYPLRLPEGSEPYEWLLRGATLLRGAVDSVDDEARQQRQKVESLEPAKHLTAAASALLKRWKTLPPDARESVSTLIEMSDQMLKATREAETESRSVFLFPRSAWKGVLKDGQVLAITTAPQTKRASTKRRKK